jgi:hypothetical protein
MPKPAYSNAEVADQFDLLANLIELEDGDRFRINAYRRAAKQIRDSSRSVTEMALAGRASSMAVTGMSRRANCNRSPSAVTIAGCGRPSIPKAGPLR